MQPHPPLDRTAALLLDAPPSGHNPLTQMAAHDAVARGLPTSSLTRLMGGLVSLSVQDALEHGIGISTRTFQRAKADPTATLDPHQSARTWAFARILAQAIDVFGSRHEAEAWLARPAIGLDQRRPIDLLSTPEGVAMVETHLTRIDHAVYA